MRFTHPGKGHDDKAHVIKMTPAVAAKLAGKSVASLRLPYAFPMGTRLFLQEFNGGPTGRADICAIIGRDGDRLVFERNWCWRQGAPEPPGLAHLKIASMYDYPIVTEADL